MNEDKMNANNLKRNLNANVKTLNLRKQILFPECESTSFLKINLRKILRKSNFILLSTIFI